MAQVTARIDENVSVGMQRFGTALPKITRKQFDKFAVATRRAIAGDYRGGNRYGVPLPPSGRNVRTGNYGQSVSYAMPDYNRVVFTNAAYRQGFNYGVLLTGDGSGSGQAWWAARRWPIMYKIIADAVTPFVEEYDAALQDGLEAAGL